MRKAALAGSLNSSEAGLVDGCGDDEHARAERGGLVGLPGIKATPGRPNIGAVLARVCQEFSADQEIGVVAAGAASVIWPCSHILAPGIVCKQDCSVTAKPLKSPAYYP